MGILLDGKLVSARVKEDVAKETAAFVAATGITPTLAVVLVGDDPASAVYVRNKQRACEAVGFRSLERRLPAQTSEEELLRVIRDYNADPDVHGILIQLPLPATIREEVVIRAIDPRKDVDAFHPVNVGALMTGNYIFLPCTPAGVMELLAHYGLPVEGKHCVIVGRSNIVGKPLFHLMLAKNATVTVCHSRTRDLSDMTRQADILVAAVGKPRMITADMIKPGAVVIDVGINRLPDGKLCGDVDFDAVADIASAITPVPGGVGPMTIAMLMKNTLTAAQQIAKNQ